MKIENKLLIAGIFLALVFVLAPAFSNVVSAQYTGCSYHAYQQCNGNYLYWYDSCGNQQDSQYCSGGCYNNLCSYNNYNNNSNYNYNYNYNNYSNCTYHAYRLCQGNNIYWYDSCGNQQDLYYSCSGGQVCQYGQCTAYIQPIQPANNYVAHYKAACYGSSIYWYDSLGTASGLYKNCQDGNSCTQDSCSASRCVNTTKCDGTTCAVGSADYNTYCATNLLPRTGTCGNGLCEPALGETNTSCSADCAVSVAPAGLSLSFSAKQGSPEGTPTASQWQKTVEADSGSHIYFMISVANSSANQINNVNVSASLPSEISSLGNLQLDGVAVLGDIVSGVDIGSLSAGSAKTIRFEAITQMLSEASTRQATATSTVSGTTQLDTISIDFKPSQAVAAVSTASSSAGLWGFVKKWYLWIIVGLVLILLFIFVFKRLSSEV